MTQKIDTSMLEDVASSSTDNNTAKDAGNAGKVVQLNSQGVIPSVYFAPLIDQWRLTADLVGSADPISANLARGTYLGGSGMSVATGVWTFPMTGVYDVSATMMADMQSNNGVGNAQLYLTVNATDGEGPTWTEISYCEEAWSHSILRVTSLVDVTSVTEVKVKFAITHSGDATSLIQGHATSNRTHFTFTRLGDT